MNDLIFRFSSFSEFPGQYKKEVIQLVKKKKLHVTLLAEIFETIYVTRLLFHCCTSEKKNAKPITCSCYCFVLGGRGFFFCYTHVLYFSFVISVLR